jgi:LacI family transcriptional regulator
MVAEASGVSTSTVSRVFSHPHRLKPSTVARVTQVAEELGYVPHHSARALSLGRMGTIGVLVPDIANPFFPPVIRAVQARAGQGGFSTLLADTDEDPARELELLSTLAQRTDGVVLVSSRLPEETVRERAGRHPLVLVNRDVDDVTRVLIDTGSGMRDAVDHLADLGHRTLVYVAGPEASWSNGERRRAVLEQSARRGIEATVLPSHRPEHEDGRRAVPEILASGAGAVIAFDDVLAQGVLAGLVERGVDVPGRVSVVGCDDIHAVRTVPPLTTIRGDSATAAARAVELLLEAVEHPDPDAGVVREVVPTTLVVRSSTARSGLGAEQGDNRAGDLDLR